MSENADEAWLSDESIRARAILRNRLADRRSRTRSRSRCGC